MRDGFRLLRTIGLALVLGVPSFGVWAAETEAAMPPELQSAVSADLRKIAAAERGYASLNPDNGLALRFEEGAVAVSPLQPRNSTEHKVSDWHWGLKLIGYGTPSAIRPVAPAQAVAAERRLEYRRGAVAEWYENRPEGLEQGFTLAEPPATGAEDLVLSLAVEGGLQPSLDPAGRAVAFRDATGAAVLHYKDLQVTDAAGKSVNQRAKLTRELG